MGAVSVGGVMAVRYRHGFPGMPHSASFCGGKAFTRIPLCPILNSNIHHRSHCVDRVNAGGCPKAASIGTTGVGDGVNTEEPADTGRNTIGAGMSALIYRMEAAEELGRLFEFLPSISSAKTTVLRWMIC